MARDPQSKRIITGRQGLECAVTALKDGELVAFATETVYGLGANATNEIAVAKIFEYKERPLFNPLIIHVSDTDNAKKIVAWNDLASRLEKEFWPGALTMILPRLPGCNVSLLASAGLDSLAVRVPRHSLAQELLKNTGFPIAAPSANKYGKISPTTALHVDEEFGPALSFILDGGPCRFGLESTVVDLTTNTPVILRPGSITKEELIEIIGPLTKAKSFPKIKSPGMSKRHYAPNASLRLGVRTPTKDELLIGFGPEAPDAAINLSPTGDLLEAATNLFSTLRKLDSAGCKKLAVMPIPNKGLGVAINDRLRRAAANN